MSDEVLEYVNGQGMCFKGTAVSTIDVIRAITIGGATPEEFLAQHPGVPAPALYEFLGRSGAAVGSLLDRWERAEESPWEQITWEDMKCQVHSDLLNHDDGAKADPEALTYDIAGQFRIGIVSDAGNESGRHVITMADVKRWGISIDDVFEEAVADTPSIWDWTHNRLTEEDYVYVYEYPDRDTGWTDFLLDPSCFLEHNWTNGCHMMFIPTQEKAILTGSSDVRGQELMLKHAIRLADGNSPVTHRPIMIEDDWTWREWQSLPDEQNPFADGYREAFGN